MEEKVFPLAGWEKQNKQENKPQTKIKPNKKHHNKKTRQTKIKANKKIKKRHKEWQKKMQILDHNLKAYKALIKSFKKSNRACIVHPTGLGLTSSLPIIRTLLFSYLLGCGCMCSLCNTCSYLCFFNIMSK